MTRLPKIPPTVDSQRGNFAADFLIVIAVFACAAAVLSALFGSSPIASILTGIYFLIFAVAVAGIAVVNATRRP